MMAVVTALQIPAGSTTATSVLIDVSYKPGYGWVLVEGPSKLLPEPRLRDVLDTCARVSRHKKIIVHIVWDLPINHNLRDDPFGALQELQETLEPFRHDNDIWILLSDCVLLASAQTIFYKDVSIGVMAPHPAMIPFVSESRADFVCLHLSHFRSCDLARIRHVMPDMYIIGKTTLSSWSITDPRKPYLDAILCEIRLF